MLEEICRARIIQLGYLPVSRDFQPVQGENPFVTFLIISRKSTEILDVKFSEKSGHSAILFCGWSLCSVLCALCSVLCALCLKQRFQRLD